MVLAFCSGENPLERLRRLVAGFHRLGPGVPREDVLHQEHVGVLPPIQLRRAPRISQDVGRPALVLVHRVDPPLVQRARREDLLLGAVQKLPQVAQLHGDAASLEHGVESLRARAVQLDPDLVDLLPRLLHVY